MARILRASGYEVYSAGTLSEAEQVLSAEAIDLMVCRVTASDGDGAEFIERTWNQRRVPSIAFAGDLSNRTCAARLPPLAVRAILAIPINLKMLLQAIASARARPGARIGICPDCHGKGSLLLLTSTRPCQTCEGTGLADERILEQR